MSKIIPKELFIRPGIYEGPIYKLTDACAYDDTFIFEGSFGKSIKISRQEAYFMIGTFEQILKRAKLARGN